MIVCRGYHGTNKEIEYFDLNHLGNNQGQSRFPGIYFSGDYNTAKEYAEYAVQKFGGRPIVYVAECKLDNPVNQRESAKLFDSFSDICKFAKEYFPSWFDSDGDLYSYKVSYLKEKLATYNGQYNLIVYAAEENGLPLIEVCQKLGFDSYVAPNEFAVTSPQQILCFGETDHQISEEEWDSIKLPVNEAFEPVVVGDADLSGEEGFRGTDLSATESMAAFETKSNDYIRAAKAGKPYKTKPGNRFLRRLQIKMNGGNATWFDIDMNRLFKKGSFALKIPVVGETSEYTCTVSFDDWLPQLKEDIINGGFNQLTVKRSLMQMLRFHDLKCRCSCPDFKYRHSYWLTVHNEIEGDPETRPSDETNPKDDLGKICKHLNFCLNNKIYGDKESRIIYNYLINLKKSQRLLFDRMVAPKLGLVEDTKTEEKKPLEQPSAAQNQAQTPEDNQQDNQKVKQMETQVSQQPVNPEEEEPK